jgi:hypothetical protein
MRFIIHALLLCAVMPSPVHAFCGFYVGKADASLFNHASKVILVRSEGRTVISMLNDYQGPYQDFALVVPVPQVLAREQIHVGDKSLFDRIDAYSAPRLAEYFDDDPCMTRRRAMEKVFPAAAQVAKDEAKVAKKLGVQVEASYTVGEYDIVILSAKQSDGLETWLLENGYRIPRGAARALRPYVRQQMKFFVARVNMKEQSLTGLTYLRPLQFAFESEKFMLPIRLGMINADGPQDLIAYVLTAGGRVESTNYRTIKLPANVDLPVGIQKDFPDFYKALFDTQARGNDLRAVFTEYFWNMAWCDPCAADPLSAAELRSAGVFWLAGDPAQDRIRPVAAPPVMLTRLHVRYTADTFPEDLMFQETADQENFQTRYVLRHAWQGDADACPEAGRYRDDLARRQEREAQTLSSLTGWTPQQIRDRYGIKTAPAARWWESLWK